MPEKPEGDTSVSVLQIKQNCLKYKGRPFVRFWPVLDLEGNAQLTEQLIYSREMKLRRGINKCSDQHCHVNIKLINNDVFNIILTLHFWHF